MIKYWILAALAVTTFWVLTATVSSLSWTSASSIIVLITMTCGRSQVQRNNTTRVTLYGFQMVFVSVLWSGSVQCWLIPLSPIVCLPCLHVHVFLCSLSVLSDVCLLASFACVQSVWTVEQTAIWAVTFDIGILKKVAGGWWQDGESLIISTTMSFISGACQPASLSHTRYPTLVPIHLQVSLDMGVQKLTEESHLVTIASICKHKSPCWGPMRGRLESSADGVIPTHHPAGVHSTYLRVRVVRFLGWRFAQDVFSQSAYFTGWWQEPPTELLWFLLWLIMSCNF